LDNIASLSASPNYIVLAKIDDDDTSMKNQTVINRLADYENVHAFFGRSSNKVHAINRGLPYGKWDILVNMSDDMLFNTVGFDVIIRNNADDIDKFIHFPDGHVNERLCTMSIMGRKYFNRFGYVYHPQYSSLWCDNEAQEVAMMLGCYKYVDQQIFTHNHPAWTGETPDEQLIQTQRYYQADEKIYNYRKANNFPI
jgi:hypothetical protein